jgi:CheY-like chemotaxis protein
MGGEITLQSELGAGSTFTVVLPVRGDEHARSLSAPAAETALRTSFTGHVLLVEDNSENRVLAVQMLQHLGCTVEFASDGQEALDMLEAARFDLVFMDCHMPKLSGYDATRALRKREGEGTHTTIIALTASVLPEERDKCIAVGMDDYIAKPFSRRDLQNMLERWL